MMQRRTRSGIAALATGAALLAGTVVMASPASAYQPASDLANAVMNTRDALPQSLIFGNFFWVRDVDGLNGPDGTPDGSGAFQWFEGNNGYGAVYAHRSYGRIWSNPIYGSILASWSSLGYENGKGYPMSAERNPVSNDFGTGKCPAGTQRVQEFERLDQTIWRRACWSPSFNVARNVYWAP